MNFKIGTDVESIERIENLLFKKPSFLEYAFTQNEIDYLNKKGENMPSSVAGIFSAKEAFSKALSTGFSGFSLKDVEILHTPLGAPYINPVGKLSHLNPVDFSLSISHSRDYATATVIFSGSCNPFEKNEYILSASQMKKADALTTETQIPSHLLMENASKALLSACLPLGNKAVILVGKGNNGGDGICLASLLKKEGREVILIFLYSSQNLSTDSKYYYDRLEEGIKVVEFSSETEEEIKEILSSSSYAVDCLFGNGFSGNLSTDAQKLLSYINIYTIACDIPSGINADNGTIAEGSHKANETVTFAQYKPCHFLYPAKDYCGKITLANIKISEETILKAGYTAKIINRSAVLPLIKKRHENSNKGSFGVLSLACGSKKMPGASLLALKGAMASGVGLCMVDSSRYIKKYLSAIIPEAIYSNSKKPTAILVGCGLGKNKREVKKQLSKNMPIVLDADALNVVSEELSLLNTSSQKILTPHPLEMARLTSKSVAEVEENRFETAADFAKKYNCVLLLKGHHTVIATPEGKLWVSQYGNSGLSKGGSGDVLAGFISGLLASGYSPEESAVLAVYCQGMASDYLKNQKGEVGYTPSDVSQVMAKFLY